MSLILASNSQIRRQMLKQAGLDFELRSPMVDEDQIKADGHVGESLALRLAQEKAKSIAAAAADWVVGSDSTVIVDGLRFSKPRDRAQAADHLRSFSGRTMSLSSAVALARAGRVEWSHAETAKLQVRPLSDGFIEQYLDLEWPEVGHCVGVFRLEGVGITLFDEIQGNYFTILGMPLLPLLGALRQRGLMPS